MFSGMTDEQREQMFKQMSQGMPMMGMMGYPMMGMPPGYPGPGGKDGEEKSESGNDNKESGGPPGMGNFPGYGMMPGMMPYGMPYGFNPMMYGGNNGGPPGNQGDDKEAGKQDEKV
jgi:hypothetical protein